MPAPLLLGSLLGMISGAASAEVRDRIIDGLMIREHIDEPRPDGRRDLGGLYSNHDGKHNIYYSSASPQYTFPHELAHAKGMLHGPWQPYGPFKSAWCAEIIKEAAEYKLGEMVCNDGRREFMLKKADFK